MPFNESLGDRVRPLIRRKAGFSEKKMFGGLGFLLHGNMCCGVWKDFLILRVGKENYEAALTEPFVEEFNMTGRAMTGWVMVSEPGFAEPDQLKDWVDQAVKFTRTLPPK